MVAIDEIRDALEPAGEAERVDEAEDGRWGERRGDELPAELARRGRRLKGIREAKRALAERARQRAAAASATSAGVRSGGSRCAWKSLSSVCVPVSSASHQSLRATRSRSPRPIRSPSLTMPTGVPAAPTTGTALILVQHRVVDAAFRGTGIRLVSASSLRRRINAAYRQGMAAGGRVNLDRPVRDRSRGLLR